MLYSDEPDFQLADSLAVLRRDIPWDIYQARGRTWEQQMLRSRAAAISCRLLVCGSQAAAPPHHSKLGCRRCAAPASTHPPMPRTAATPRRRRA